MVLSPTSPAPSAARRTPELLAPAGGPEQLAYAVRFGADAVYLAAERFGMRARAANFALADIPAAVSYAHEHGVRVHVACNVVMHDADLDELPGFFRTLEAAGADAVIVGDLGALRLARRHAPNLAVHVSTQASVSNAEAALTWYELGARRIVCARELSLDAIARLRAELPAELELECFVHGSMCMAYAGRCLISDYLTGRSASGGHCTQPCRWSYALQEAKRPGEYFDVEEDGRGSYILNSRDLNMLAHLRELADAGVDAVKIEGRNRKAFYVAAVVNAYRQVLDGADPAAFAGELETFSHRPYSTGFYFGPAHQAPLSADSAQLCDWVAEVVACRPAAGAAGNAGGASAGDAAGDCRWEVEVRERNRFEEGDRLEVLSPGRPVRAVEVRGLRWIPASAGEGGGEVSDATRAALPDEPQAVSTACRAMERYLFDSTVELQPHDILRARRPDASLA